MEHIDAAIRASAAALEDEFMDASMAYDYGEIDAGDLLVRMGDAVLEEVEARLGRELGPEEFAYVEDYAAAHYAADML